MQFKQNKNKEGVFTGRYTVLKNVYTEGVGSKQYVVASFLNTDTEVPELSNDKIPADANGNKIEFSIDERVELHRFIENQRETLRRQQDVDTVSSISGVLQASVKAMNKVNHPVDVDLDMAKAIYEAMDLMAKTLKKKGFKKGVVLSGQ